MFAYWLLSAVLVLTLGFGQDAFAYIGPGAGLSMVGAFWALIVAVFAAISFLLLWPFRRMFARNKSSKNANRSGNDAIHS